MADSLATLGRPPAEPLAARAAALLAGWAGWLRELTGWRRLAVTFGLGGVGALAMPPGYAVPLLFVIFPALLWILEGVRRRRTAFLVGWTFAFGFFVCGLYWVGFALTVDLASFFWFLPLAVTGLPALMSLHHGVATLLLVMLPVRGVARCLAFAVLWAAAEWFRGHMPFGGFPWNLIGYTWVGWLPVLQSVSVIGIYGLGLLTLAAAALPAALVRPAGSTTAAAGQAGAAVRWSRPALTALAAALLLFAALGVAGGARLAAGDAGTVAGVRLRLVQPDIPQAAKLDRSRYAEHFLLFQAMTSAPAAQPVTHVIWPETAVPYLVDSDANARIAIANITPTGGMTITGGPRLVEDGNGRRIYNSLFAVTPDATVAGTYDKSHLVPFGEYVPLAWMLPFGLGPVAFGFTPGDGIRTLDLPGLPPVSPLICYEAIFPGAVAEPPSSPPGADGPARRPAWLLNLTNDAWYGPTAGPYQHFAISRTRAVEEGLPLVRSATTGISGVVDAYGRVVARLGLDRQGVLDSDLPAALPAATIYARWHDLPFWALAAALGAVATAVSWPTRRERG